MMNSNIFSRLCGRKSDHHQTSPESYQRQDTSDFLSRAEEMEGTRREALIRQSETICAADKARTGNVWRRLFFKPSPDSVRSPPPSPPPPPPPAPPPPPPAPPAPPEPRRRVSQLPVMTVNQGRTIKEVANTYRLQTADGKVEAIQKTLEDYHEKTTVHIPQPPQLPRRKPGSTPLTPAPPPKPAPTQRRRPRHEVVLPPAMTDTGDKKKDITVNPQAANHENLEKLQRLRHPEAELSLSLQLLTSEDWMKKVEGLRIIRAVAQHHAQTLIPRLYRVCTSLGEEVRNPRSAVAVAAIDTLRYLYIYLQKNMDPLVERTGVCLLQRIAQSNANVFIQQQVNVALEAMVQNCSSGRVLSLLLNTGLNNLNPAVRTSAAQQLHLLADMMGVDAIFEADESFTHKFLTAVSKTCLDAHPRVRTHGHDIVRKMSTHKDLMRQLNGIISDKHRWPLARILRNAN